jgi:hypothetical protein
MAISQGFLIICSKTQVWYTDLIEILKLKIEAQDANMEVIDAIDSQVREYTFEELTVKSNSRVSGETKEYYNIVGINDLGKGNAALIVEEVEDNFLVFFRLDFLDFGKILEINLIEKAPTDR